MVESEKLILNCAKNVKKIGASALGVGYEMEFNNKNVDVRDIELVPLIKEIAKKTKDIITIR